MVVITKIHFDHVAFQMLVIIEMRVKKVPIVTQVQVDNVSLAFIVIHLLSIDDEPL